MKINVSVKKDKEGGNKKPRLKAVFPALLEFSEKTGLILAFASKEKDVIRFAMMGIEKNDISIHLVVDKVEKQGKTLVVEVSFDTTLPNLTENGENNEKEDEVLAPIDLGDGVLLHVGNIYHFVFKNGNEAEFYIEEGEKILSVHSFALKDGNFYNPLSPYLDCNTELLKELINSNGGLVSYKKVSSILEPETFKEYLAKAKAYCQEYVSDENVHYAAETLLNILKIKKSEDVSEQAFVEHLKVFEQEYFNKCS